MYLRLGTVCDTLVKMSERERNRDTKREGKPQRPMGVLPNPSVLFGFPSNTLI
jgi:hypothetical protein